MFIKSITIHNYKSFYNAPEIQLTEGINIIVGQNNVGKTSFLEALASKAEYGHAHFSEETKPTPTSTFSPTPWVSIMYGIPPQEFIDIMINEYNSQFDIAISEGYLVDNLRVNDAAILNRQINEIFEKEIIIESEKKDNTFYFKIKDIHLEFIAAHHQIKSGNLRIQNKKNPKFSLNTNNRQERFDQLTSFSLFSNIPTRNIYFFKAQRYNVGQCHNHGATSVLQPDASNLPIVLNKLKENRIRFDRYIDKVKQVFPNIQDVNIKTTNSADLTIMVWMHNVDSERDDLAVPLSECGTGISQVLAMLYVVVNSDFPKTIIIDEPNSFLHPRAVNSLLDIFKEYKQHQYIIATHSATLISNSNANNVILFGWENQKTKLLHQSNKLDVHSVLQLFSEVGTKLSDVFGYDAILWVEGPTEESCFPKIIEKLLKKSTTNLAIKSLIATGDFETDEKSVNLAVRIYKSLSKGNALVPPTLGFFFDKEGRSDAKLLDIKKRFNVAGEQAKIFFTAKRLYENYLLDAEAITTILNQETYFDEKDQSLNNYLFTQDKIEQWLEENKNKSEYWDNKQPSSKQLENWKDEIHAAKLLENLFKDKTDKKNPYHKTTHSIKLTEWLIDNKSEALEEIKNNLKEFCK